MAQGAVATMATNGNGTSLTAEELREILEYEKIIQFRDAIFAGTHPRINIPPHVLQQHSATRNFSSPTTSRVNNSSQPQPAQSTSHSEDQSSYFRSPNNNRQAANGQVSKTGKSEINPILLEKSDDLIKAEMQLQRQRLERALRDQIEQQRITAKAMLQQSESLPNFDISQVLSKAQALVNPSTEAQQDQPMADDEPAAASDSFDENTFYSSQHDSSEWSNSSPGQKEQGEMQSHGLVSVDERPVGVSPARNRAEQPERAMKSLSTNNLAAQSQHSQFQTNQSQKQLQNSLPVMSGALVAERTSTNSSPQDSDRGRGGQSSANARNNGDSEIVQSTSDQLIRQAFEQDQASPLIRAHNLSPVAPQPARVSPLATAREPPILRENIVIDEAQPAQVTALRNQPAGISSADSSPKGTKKSEKKKKKKRKAKDNADTPESPYIKAEPRSPSPFPVAPLPRPQKRQRQSDTYGGAELNYDEPPRYEPAQPTQARPAERYPERRESGAYERRDDRYEPEFRRPPPAIRRIEEDNYRRVSSPVPARRPESPRVYALPPSEARHLRAASLAMVDRREEPRYFREPVIRASVRPDADRERSRSPIIRDRISPLAIAPPRQPVRIIIDEHGREYIDPVSTAVSRQSVAPVNRYREPEVIYDRGPVRTVSGRPPVDTFEEDGVIYRRASPAPRRVVTEPEYAMPPPDYRSYRERDYSARPTMPPPGDEYVQIRGGPERRPVAQYEEPVREYLSRDQIVREEPVREYARPIIREEIPREYGTRAMSVRPEAVRYIRDEPPRGYARAPSVRPDAATRYEIRDEIPREYDTRAPSRHPEAIRYEEAPREYAPRLQSVRPEGPPREYAPREIVQRAERAYSVVPVDASGRREVMPPPNGERYYEEAPRGRPSEVAFIERPRARESSVVVYADDVRREVYR